MAKDIRVRLNALLAQLRVPKASKLGRRWLQPRSVACKLELFLPGRLIVEIQWRVRNGIRSLEAYHPSSNYRLQSLLRPISREWREGKQRPHVLGWNIERIDFRIRSQNFQRQFTWNQYCPSLSHIIDFQNLDGDQVCNPTGQLDARKESQVRFTNRLARFAYPQVHYDFTDSLGVSIETTAEVGFWFQPIGNACLGSDSSNAMGSTLW